jgi:P27 family predicted phage terminase small subunit
MPRRLPGEQPIEQPSNHVAGRPKMPADFADRPIAMAKWKELVAVLFKRGVLTKGDGTALEIICNQYERLMVCQKDIRDNGVMTEEEVGDGNGGKYTRRTANPCCKMATALENSIRAMLQQFSATPATRERSKPAKEKQTPKAPTKRFKVEDELSPNALALLARLKKESEPK